ncbi:hypothetical protein [Candidatus Chlorohelix sp.]|uniref:hypothetical protein n=1 Tax=Candidatus Chlorohelix sp. TaxID=3139201 RepID=UPI00305C2D85
MRTKEKNKSTRFSNPFKNDPFITVTITWSLGLVAMVLMLTFAAYQLEDRLNVLVTGIPFFVTLFGCAYMVKFIGCRPLYYTGMAGFFVGVGLAFVGLLEELFNGLYWESFARFVLVAIARGAPLVFVGMFAGWWATRGRIPIEIEIPGKKEVEEATKSGLAEPAPRIITPLSAMPGSKTTNAAMLEQLEKDPASLLSERERHKRLKNTN